MFPSRSTASDAQSKLVTPDCFGLRSRLPRGGGVTLCASVGSFGKKVLRAAFRERNLAMSHRCQRSRT